MEIIMNAQSIKRPSWDEIHMLDAIRVSTRSSCLVRPVGASLVRDNRVIASGYNGAPSGIKSCLELEECFYQRIAFEDSKKGFGAYEQLKEERKSLCIAVHAEVNALSQCAKYGPSSVGATLYITNCPCPPCTRNEILAKGVSEVKIWKGYLANPLLTLDEKNATEHLLEQASIPFSYVDLSEERMKEIFSLMLVSGNRTSYNFQP
jgi:dCMP deaminase